MNNSLKKILQTNSKINKSFGALRLCVKPEFCMKLIIILLFTICLYSCKNSDPVSPSQPDTSTNFKYPLTANSNWFHTTKDFVFNIRPDSIRYHLSADTLIENGFSILKNDTVINGITYKIFKTDHSSTAHAYTSLEYFRQADTGLVSASVSFEGNGFGPYRPSSSIFVYNQKVFHSIHDIVDYASANSNNNSLVTQELKCIAYPIVPGQSWFFRKVDTITDQYKSFQNYILTSCPAGTFNCMVIKRQNIYGGIPDTNTVLLDYYSKIGMIKRDYTIKNVAYTSSTGQVIGYFDIKDDVILNSYFIQ